MSEILSLSRDDRAQLAAHVQSVGGWPAGFGHLGTRIVHEFTADGSFSVLSEDAAHLWADLCKLASDAGLLAKPAPVPVEAPAEPAPPAETKSAEPVPVVEEKLDAPAGPPNEPPPELLDTPPVVTPGTGDE